MATEKEAEELQQQGDERLKTKVPGAADEPLIHGDEGEEPSGDEAAEVAAAATDEEREAIRARRREERVARKEHRRQKEEESRRLISSLQRQNQELSGRLQAIEQRNTGTDLAQIDHAIGEAAGYAEEAKRRMDAAVTAQDGKALAEANEVYYAARRRAEDLAAYKAKLTQARPERPVLDPALVTQARNWMGKYSWYDPSGRDQDSRVVIAVDQALADEGTYDPRTPEYWQELDSRVKKYLPHRVKQAYNDSAGTVAAKSGPMIAGSGREGSASAGGEPSGFRLSKERVDALKDAGLWDDEKAREKAIARYRAYDKEHGNASR